MFVTAKYTVKDVGDIVQGAVVEGEFNVGDEIKFLPSRVSGTIRSMQRFYRATTRALPGDTVSMKVKLEAPSEAADVRVGDIAVLPQEKKLENCLQIRAHVFVVQTRCVHDRRIRVGFRSMIYIGCDHQMCVVQNIEWKKERSTGNSVQENPLFVEAGDDAQLVLTLNHPMAVSKFDDCKIDGRFVTVTHNMPVMYGKVL